MFSFLFRFIGGRKESHAAILKTLGSLRSERGQMTLGACFKDLNFLYLLTIDYPSSKTSDFFEDLSSSSGFLYTLLSMEVSLRRTAS